MPLTFANPSLLFGALAAAVPIIIHLLSRRRIHRQPFSDLRFLEDVQAKQSRKIGIRSLLLLLLRVLAILCVVLAIARPQVGGLAPARGSARSLLFVLDASASMQTQHDGGTRFATAQAAIADMLAALPQGTEVQILSVGAAAEPLLASWTTAAAPVRTALAAAQPTDGPFHLAAALHAARTWTQQSRWQAVDIVLVSDLQRTQGGLGALREAVAAFAVGDHPRLLIRAVGEAVPNGGILAVHLPMRAIQPGETIDIAATVLLDQSEQSFVLEIDEQRVAESVATGKVGSVIRVVFTVTAPETGLHRGRIFKDSDRLPVDDARPFVMTVWNRISVLLVHGADRGTAGRGGWRYVAEALHPEGSGQSLFAVRSVPSGQLVAGDLNGVDVVFFIDPDPLGRQLLGGFLEWLTNGGAAVFCVGDPTLESYLQDTLLPALGLPTNSEYRARPESGRENVSLLTRGHPIFNGLDRDAVATLQDISWQRYYVLEEGSGRVLLEFTSEAPAMIEGRYREGTFIWLPYNFYPNGSDLALNPMFLPILQRLAAYLAQGGRTDNEGAFEVGQRPEVPLKGAQKEEDRPREATRLAMTTPSTGEVAIPAELTWRRGIPILVGPATRQKGFYVFTSGVDTVGVVAAVPPGAESDPTLLSSEEFQTLLASAGLSETADLGSVGTVDFAAALAGRDISVWLLALAFLLLCIESYLARGTSPYAAVA